MSDFHSQHIIAIIGPHDTVSGFAALGVEAHPANSAADVLERLREIKALTIDETKPVVCAVVCIIEDLLQGIDRAEYEKITAGALPAVVLLPGPQGSQGYAEARLRQLSEQAVGSAII
jgi:V/A-type H+-transporting ATPase subunit F